MSPTEALPVWHIVLGGPIGEVLLIAVAFLGGVCIGFATGRYHAKWGGSI